MTLAALDDPAYLAKTDPAGFLASVEAFPSQLQDAWQRSASVEFNPAPALSIAVLGMGGSGISGDVASAVLSPGAPLPAACVKGYELPGWVGPQTLVFAASYSGNTEETLSCFEEALRRGAQIVAIAGGGELAARANREGLALVEVPPGLQPRAALGYMSVPILELCGRAGYLPGAGEDFAAALEAVRMRALECGAAASQNPAKALAASLEGLFPIVYSAGALGTVAAYRWKCQLNENSKVPAAWNVFPELNHNEVVGWDGLGGMTGGSAVVLLRHSWEHPRVSRRIEATLGLIGGRPARVEQVHARGPCPMAQLFDLMYFGDFVTTYLAIAQGIDPTPVEAITKLKKALEASQA